MATEALNNIYIDLDTAPYGIQLVPVHMPTASSFANELVVRYPDADDSLVEDYYTIRDSSLSAAGPSFAGGPIVLVMLVPASKEAYIINPTMTGAVKDELEAMHGIAFSWTGDGTRYRNISMGFKPRILIITQIGSFDDVDAIAVLFDFGGAGASSGGICFYNVGGTPTMENIQFNFDGKTLELGGVMNTNAYKNFNTDGSTYYAWGIPL